MVSLSFFPFPLPIVSRVDTAIVAWREKGGGGNGGLSGSVAMGERRRRKKMSLHDPTEASSASVI